MQLSNEIVLRPRFKKSLAYAAETVLASFEGIATTTNDFKVSRVDDHVFIRIPKNKQHFWSPQLHLEIYEDPTNGTQLKGLFGPNPGVWTMFMFFHFAVAGLFIMAGIWIYTNFSLSQSTVIPMVAMIVLVLLWLGLYVAGRLGKKAGEKEMSSLYSFMKEVLSSITNE